MRRLDHAAIFVLIACSFTPVHTILFRGWGRQGMLLLVWTVAIAGITLKMIFFQRNATWAGVGLIPRHGLAGAVYQRLAVAALQF